MINATAADLTTPATSIPRTKYFPFELYCVGMIPNTVYDIYLDGILWNAYCKPFGGNLGSPLKAGANGKIKIQMHVAVKYSQQYLVKPNTSNTNIMTKTHTVTLIDPFNNSSTMTIPIQLKSGAINA